MVLSPNVILSAIYDLTQLRRFNAMRYCLYSNVKQHAFNVMSQHKKQLWNYFLYDNDRGQHTNLKKIIKTHNFFNSSVSQSVLYNSKIAHTRFYDHLLLCVKTNWIIWQLNKNKTCWRRSFLVVTIINSNILHLKRCMWLQQKSATFCQGNMTFGSPD